jgi:hypothetical protein
MRKLQADLRVASAISAVIAVVLTVEIAGMHPSGIAGLAMAFLPAVLAVVTVGLVVLSIEIGRGSDGGGGFDGRSDLPPLGPTGGLAIDWDAFEADFRAYVDLHDRVLV